ncbi:hypothetical protein EV360DRAFT_90796 [Lentinula raphanica]|nr:hypothetical protein EV360DRAFT_90796 [Lentinula raphanica]
MRLLPTHLLPKMLFLSLIVSAMATPIIIRPRGNGSPNPEEDARKELVSSSQSLHMHVQVSTLARTLKSMIELMMLVLIREEKVNGEFAMKAVGTHVESDERWMLAWFPVHRGSNKSRNYGLRTIQKQLEGGHYVWERDATFRQKGGSPYQLCTLASVSVRHGWYEELVTVELSSKGKVDMTRELNKISPAISLFYLHALVETAVEQIQVLEKVHPQHISNTKIYFPQWTWILYAPMVYLRGSAAGFVITREEHPYEWKFYLEAERKLIEGSHSV